jgi:hypothetical protein
MPMRVYHPQNLQTHSRFKKYLSWILMREILNLKQPSIRKRQGSLDIVIFSMGLLKTHLNDSFEGDPGA